MVDATTNPDQANALLAGALSNDSVPAAAPQQVSMPTIAPPPDRQVALMAGLVNQLEGTTATDAVVRELTGADEEALSAPAVARSVTKYLGELVLRGTESIGGQKPTKQQLDSLLVGDRELLLLGVRKATFGNELELRTTCPHCGDVDEDFVYDLNDIRVEPLGNPEKAIYGYDFTLPSGRVATLSLSRAADQDAVLTAETKSSGELNTLMLARLVQKIDGELCINAAPIRALGLRDRRALQEEVTENTPGPRLGEAKRTCSACEKEFELGFGLLDIFQA
jgi:hypothetical protein